MTPFRSRPVLLAAGLWLAVVVIPPVALWRARGPWLESLDRPEAQAAWDEFRRDMAGQTGRDGPVQRKIPRSPEPPLRVWLRDYFSLAVGAWLAFAGVAGLLLLVLLWGSLAGPAAGRVRSTMPSDHAVSSDRAASSDPEGPSERPGP
jgi:hypothetical protein